MTERVKGECVEPEKRPHLCGRICISVAVSCHLPGPPHVVIADGLPPNTGRGLLKSLHTLVYFLCKTMR